jgi:hypothetical protein
MTLKKNCICCNNNDLYEVLDLKEQPLANNFVTTPTELPKYPLKLNLCKNCYHLQLSYIVNPDILFKNYLYVSGTSRTLREYFKWFGSFVQEYTTKSCGDILEIACNDGTQLDVFRDLGWNTYGVDPAENITSTISKTHKIVCDYFNKNLFNGKRFDVIVAQNVFAHNENAYKFLTDCMEYMKDDSFLFIQTSQSEMIQNNEFDTIYHEHISFFNIKSFFTLCKRVGINLIDVVKSPIHGVSYIFIMSKVVSKPHLINNLISLEKNKKLYDFNTYINYKNNVLTIRDDFVQRINQYKQKGYIIIGYGAAAKGMTFLNFCNTKLDVIIDDSSLKHNLYTPGSNIVIKDLNYIRRYSDDDIVVFVPLAWNFYTEIVNKIKSVRNNKKDMYLKYFPQLEVN